MQKIVVPDPEAELECTDSKEDEESSESESKDDESDESDGVDGQGEEYENDYGEVRTRLMKRNSRTVLMGLLTPTALMASENLRLVDADTIVRSIGFEDK